MTNATDAGATPVRVLIGSPVARITPDADLYEISDTLTRHDVGLLVVGTASTDVRGVVSERDIVGALANKRSPDRTRASDIAHTTLVWCDVDATVAEVAQQMMNDYVRHVLVEDNGRLVGIVSAPRPPRHLCQQRPRPPLASPRGCLSPPGRNAGLAPRCA